MIQVVGRKKREEEDYKKEENRSLLLTSFKRGIVISLHCNGDAFPYIRDSRFAPCNFRISCLSVRLPDATFCSDMRESKVCGKKIIPGPRLKSDRQTETQNAFFLTPEILRPPLCVFPECSRKKKAQKIKSLGFCRDLLFLWGEKRWGG